MASGTVNVSAANAGEGKFPKVRERFDYTTWTGDGDVTWHMEITESDPVAHTFKAVATSVEVTITKSLELGSG